MQRFAKTGLAFAFLLLIVFHPIAFLGQTFQAGQSTSGVLPDGPYGFSGSVGMSDTFGFDAGGSGWQIDAETELLSRAFRQWRWPLWNPHQMMGTPLLHNLQLSPFFPLRWLSFFFPSPVTYDVLRFLLLLFAGVFSFCFLKLWKLSDAAAFLGGTAFMLSGFVVVYLPFSFIDAVVSLPFLFYLSEKSVREPSAAHLGWLAFGIGSVLLCGYPVPVFLTIVSTLAYLLYRTLAQPAPLKLAARLSFALILSVCLSAILLLPGIEELLSTQNQRPRGLGLAAESPLRFAAVWIPNLLSSLKQPLFWSGWQGVLPFILAVLALTTRRSAPVLFFLGVSLLAYGKLIGLWPFQWLAHLPFFDRVYYPRYLHAILAFAMAMLAAFGAEGLLKQPIPKPTRRIILIASGIVLLTALWLYSDVEALRPWHLNQLPKRLGLWFLWLTVATITLICLPRLPHPAIILVVVVAAELGSYHLRQRNQRYPLFTKAPYIEFLQKDKTPYRIAALDPILIPPHSSVFRIDDLRWMNAIATPHYIDWIQAFLCPSCQDRFVGNEPGLRSHFFDINGNLSQPLHIANVKYLLLLEPIEEGSHLRKVYDGEIQIYENLNVLPRARIVHTTLPVKNTADAIQTMQQPGWNATHSAVVESNLALKGKHHLSKAPKLVSQAQTIRLSGTVTRPGLLVLSELDHPHWKARLNGKPTPILRTNGAFRGIALTQPGPYEVEFFYDDPLFNLGKWISLGSLGLIVFLILARTSAATLLRSRPI